MQKYTVTVDEGDVYWYKHNTHILHREEGPAIVTADNSKHWFKNGKRHRLDGPAVEYCNGLRLWYVEDNQYTEFEFKNLISNLMSKCCF